MLFSCIIEHTFYLFVGLFRAQQKVLIFSIKVLIFNIAEIHGTTTSPRFLLISGGALHHFRVFSHISMLLLIIYFRFYLPVIIALFIFIWFSGILARIMQHKRQTHNSLTTWDGS